MGNYECKVIFNSPAQKVFEALTTTEGLRGWWTTSCDVGSEVGSNLTVRFGEAFMAMEIRELVPHEFVKWECVKQRHGANTGLRKTDEWLGTTMAFRLSTSKEGKTELDFLHEGLTPALECYNLCRGGWDHYLKVSLKGYVDSDEGSPYIEIT